jgi:hypothetical protein
MTRQRNEDPHEIALACLEILDSIDNKAVTDAVAKQLRKLSRLAAKYPDPDPYASPDVMQLSGKYSNSWHGAVVKVAADWGARLPATLADARRSGQTAGCPSLWADAEELRAQLKAEAQAQRTGTPGKMQKHRPKEQRIPAKYRTIPMSKQEAARWLGYTLLDEEKRPRRKIKDAVELLSKSMDDGIIKHEKLSRQRFVFDRRDFPIESHSKIIPTGKQNLP